MVRIFFLFRVRKKQVVMPAFFVPSLAAAGKLLLFVPPPGPLRGGGVSLRSEKPYSRYKESVRVSSLTICAIFAP